MTRRRVAAAALGLLATALLLGAGVIANSTAVARTNAVLDQRGRDRDAGECVLFDAFLRGQLQSDQRAALLALRDRNARRALPGSPCLLPVPAAGDPPRLTETLPAVPTGPAGAGPASPSRGPTPPRSRQPSPSPAAPAPRATAPPAQPPTTPPSAPSSPPGRTPLVPGTGALCPVPLLGPVVCTGTT